MQLTKAIEEVFKKPPIKYEPAKHSLKAWAMYCLRDRGFKVIYADKGDFAVETRSGDKLYFKVTDHSADLETPVGWIIWDQATNSVSVIAPPQ